MKRTPQEVLEVVFQNCLNEEQKARLLYHAKRGTTILCGGWAGNYIDGSGGA